MANLNLEVTLGRCAVRLASEELEPGHAALVARKALDVLVSARRQVSFEDCSTLEREIADALCLWTETEVEKRVDHDRTEDIDKVADVVFRWGRTKGDRFELVDLLIKAGQRGIAEEFRRKAIMIAGV